MLWVISSIFAMIGAAVSWTFGLIWLLLTLIARWLVFQKAGEQGWKSVIPLYNDYTAYKIAWEPNMFWAWLAFTLVGNMAENAADGRFWSIPGMLGGICALAVTLIVLGYSMNMAKSFGKGILFGIGLWLLEPVFMMILGFGSARYQKY